MKEDPPVFFEQAAFPPHNEGEIIWVASQNPLSRMINILDYLGKYRQDTDCIHQAVFCLGANILIAFSGLKGIVTGSLWLFTF